MSQERNSTTANDQEKIYVIRTSRGITLVQGPEDRDAVMQQTGVDEFTEATFVNNDGLNYVKKR